MNRRKFNNTLGFAAITAAAIPTACADNKVDLGEITNKETEDCCC